MPTRDAPHPGRFDLAGAATSTLGMTALVYGFVRAARHGWTDHDSVASLVGGAALLGAFVATERHAAQPVTPLHLLASRRRSGAYLARLLLVGGLFPIFFFLTQFLQSTRGFTPVAAGIAYLPMTAAMFAASDLAPKLARIVSPARLVAGALLLAALGSALLGRLTAATRYLPGVAGPMLLVGLGVGIAFTILTTAAIDDVAPADAGAASGLVNVAHQLGGTLGLSMLIAVFAAAHRTRDFAHAVGTALSGSAVMLALASLVAALTVGRAGPREH